MGRTGACACSSAANAYRDGDLEAGIVIHESSHGLSTWLTGGPADSGCLGWGESGGMEEGWVFWRRLLCDGCVGGESGAGDQEFCIFGDTSASSSPTFLRVSSYLHIYRMTPPTHRSAGRATSPDTGVFMRSARSGAEILWVVSQALSSITDSRTRTQRHETSDVRPVPARR
ncbi:hypothetical protein H2248_008896 [Termitomyces sp. 'cryptogamus']|nr:hypothetical protein H2248_008896 [Termitomyces sp. 'cryptogamus']